MKKGFSLVIALTLSFCAAVSAAPVSSGTYENRAIGIKISFPPQWDLYDGEKNAPEDLKSVFRNRAAQDQPLFLAVHANQQAFSRLLVEEYRGTAIEYFNLLYVQQEGKTDILSARYDVLNDVVQWEFRSGAGQVKLSFIETIAKQCDSVVRLGFWTFAPLYAKYRGAFEQITEETALLGKGQAGQRWTTPWHDLHKKLEGGEIDYVKTAAAVAPEPISTPECKGEKRPVLWKVKGLKNTVYLFGSIHLGRPDFYPLLPAVESSFDRSRHLVVEIDTTSDAFRKDVARFMASSRLPEGRSVRDVLSPGVYRRLTEEVDRLGLPFDSFERLRPWVSAVTLLAMKLQSMGYMPDFGADRYFLDRAEGKDIRELESFGEQVRLFESIGEERFLAYTLLSLNVMELKSGQMISAWRCGDLKTLQKILFEDLDSNVLDNVMEIYEKFFFERNRKMADKIKTYLQKEGDYFVVVGAGHLVGDRSVVDLLQAEGYQITGP